MKHIVEEFDVYSFSELAEEAQQIAIRQEQQNENRMDWDWYKFIYDDYISEFAKIGIDDADFSFDLYNGYVNLIKGTPNIDKIIEGLQFKHNTKTIFKDFLENYIDNGKLVLDWFFDYNNSYPRLAIYFDAVVNKLMKDINDKIDALLHKLYKALNEEYFASISEDTVREELLDSDTLYYKDGRIYSY